MYPSVAHSCGAHVSLAKAVQPGKGSAPPRTFKLRPELGEEGRLVWAGVGAWLGLALPPLAQA